MEWGLFELHTCNSTTTFSPETNKRALMIWISAELIGGEIAFERAGSSWPWMWSGGVV